MLLTQPADWTVVGLVTKGVCTGVAQTQVSAGQNESVSQIRQTDNTFVAVVTVLIVGWLEREKNK